MSDIKYGYKKTLKGTKYEDARERAIAALSEEGFGVLTEIDVKATLKKKLDADFRPYTILGACNPKLAHQALETEPQIGLLLPCNVVVQEADGGATVSVISPRAVFAAVENPALEPIADEVEQRVRRALDSLA